MKKLKVTWVTDSDNDKHPVLFSNQCLLDWQTETGQSQEVLFDEAMEPAAMAKLFYLGIHHGYKQTHRRVPYTEAEIVEQLSFDEHFVESCMEAFQEQWVRKLRSLGFDEEAKQMEAALREGKEEDAPTKKKRTASKTRMKSA